ncbi:MAG: hypothetical protein ACREB6_11685 [Rhodospirillales bacterium]
MTKFDWDKLNATKRVEHFGNVRMSLAEMPLSWDDVIAGLVPPHLQESMHKFAWSVIVADLNQSKPPAIPEKLRAELQPRIDRKGGVLPFAKWLLDADFVKWAEEKKLERKQKQLERKLENLEKQLLHQAAKYELGLIDADDVIARIPVHLGGTIMDPDSLMKWAKSRPVYNNILTQKRREMEKKRKRQFNRHR